MYAITTATKKIASLNKRIRAIQGGTSASKTISIILLLVDYCQSDILPTLTSIVSESLPHLKRGAIKDFQDIMKAHDYWHENRWNATDKIYTFETGSKIEFFGADQPDKLRGARRDRLFINECNNVHYNAFQELEVRTKDLIFLDWNPTNEFWYDEFVKNRPDVDFIIVTYKDNEALDQQIVSTIEQRRNDKNWFRVYGEGLVGDIQSRIYTGWQIIDDIPHEARLERTGLDFGYTNDPTAILDVYYYNGGYIWDEVAYQTGLSNKQIADILSAKALKALVKADKAEPKSIDEIKSYGVLIMPSIGGQGSVQQGISFVQAQRVSITKRSVNVIKSYRNYVNKTDKDGKILNEPEHLWSHAMDAGRYAMEDLYHNSLPDEQERADRLMTRLRNIKPQTI